MSLLQDFPESAYQRYGKPVVGRFLDRENVTIDRSNLQEAAESWISFGERETFSPAPPEGPPPVPSELREKNRELSVPQPFVCELEDVELVGPLGLTIHSDGRYILEQANGTINRLTDTIVRTALRGGLPVRSGHVEWTHERPLASLVDIWSTGYFHWFSEALPRVRGIERYHDSTGVYPDILIPTDSPTWLAESLRLVGVPEERIMEWTGGRLRAKRLVVPSIPRHAYADRQPWGRDPSPKALGWVAERIREKSDVTVSGPNRLLVLRQDAATRRLRNREAIKGALKPLNFEPVVLSRLTLKEQVERFASASVVVGPHGAGFTNIIYGEDIELLEIFGKYVNPCYYSICGGLGLGYNYLRGNQVEQDIHIDPTVVRAHAERLC